MRPRILVSLLTEKQLFQQRQAREARAAALAAEVDLEVVFAGENLTKQIQELMRQIEAPAGSRPAAIVLEPVIAEGLEKVARHAAEAGIGWILLEPAPYLAALSRDFPKLPIAQVIPDNRQVGFIQAQQFRELLPKGGQIVYVEGPGGSAATINRRRAMEEGIRGSGIRVHKIWSDWTESGAEREMGAWLSSGKQFRPDLIGCQNDSIAIGALRAIRSAKPDWKAVRVTGVDGLPEEGQRLVREGALAATVICPNNAGKAVELAVRSLQGEPISSLELPVESFPRIEDLARKTG